MRRDGLLHADLIGVVAGLGHGETLIIADAGLPIPAEVRRIDLAVRPGLPTVPDVLDVVIAAGVFESATIALELRTSDPGLAARLAEPFPPEAVAAVTHEELKRMSRAAAAAVRTGDFRPFANVILRAGVAF